MSVPTPDLRFHADGSATLAAPVDGRGPLRSAAVVVSQVASPPVLALGVVFLAATLEGGGSAFAHAAIQIAFMVFFPVAVLIGLVRSGRVGDLDVYRREERWRPFLATVAGAWIGWTILRASAAPDALSGVAGVLALEATVIFVITLGWKISLHCATVAVVGSLVWKITGWPLPLFVGIPLMIWSRLLLRRHTPAQTIAGTLVGILLVVAFFDLFARTV